MRLVVLLCLVLFVCVCVLGQDDYYDYEDYDYDYDYEEATTQRTTPRPTTTRRTPRPTPRRTPRPTRRPTPRPTRRPTPRRTPRPIPRRTPRPIPRRTPRPIPRRTPRPVPRRTPRPTPRWTPRPTPRWTPAPRVTVPYKNIPPRWTPRPLPPQTTVSRRTIPPRVTWPVDPVRSIPGYCLTARDLEQRCPRHWTNVAKDMERQVGLLHVDKTHRSNDYDDLSDDIRAFAKLIQDLRNEVEWFSNRIKFADQPLIRDSAGPMDTSIIWTGGKKFADCQDASGGGGQKTGVYILRPQDSPYDIRAYCDNGWTVFQRRFDGSVNFYRSWSDYMVGFGNYSSEFWLGLENLHYLTNQDDYTIRIDMQAYSGKWYYAIYPGFSIGDERSYYELSVGNMTAGTAQDGLTESNGYGFSTMDKDNDDWFRGNCASHYFGAWWLHNCGNDLNRRYCRLDGPGCMEWEGQSLRKTIMRIKPSRAVQSDDLAPNA